MNLHILDFFLIVSAHSTLVIITKNVKIAHNYDIIPYLGMTQSNSTV